jgi:hypothetical protein
MAAHLWHPKRPVQQGSAPLEPSFGIEQYLTYLAYSGQYNVEQGVVSHNLSNCLVPDWEGKTLKRYLGGYEQGFSLTTAPMITDEAIDFTHESHQKLSWLPDIKRPDCPTIDFAGCWQLSSINVGDGQMKGESKGQCIITKQGICRFR